jgi:hypothetical protein
MPATAPVAGSHPPFGVHLSGPVSSPSDVRPVRRPTRPVSGRLMSGPLVSDPLVSTVRRPASGVRRPASGRLVSARLSGRVRLLPRQPGGGLGDHSVRRATFTTGTGRVACGLPRPGRLGQRLESAWTQATLRRSSGGQVGQKEVSAADLAGCAPGGGGRRPRSTADRSGRPDRREGALCWRLSQVGEWVEARRSCTCRCLPDGCRLGLNARPLSVVVVEPGAPSGPARKGQ